MPTPFMHLAFAQRVIADQALSGAAKTLLTENWGAFLLGSIAPDARVSSGLRRADTHFFEYEAVIATPPVNLMLERFPNLSRAALSSETQNDAQIAFIAGYAAHLTMDEIWCVELLFPYFMRQWDDEFTSFKMLHMLLATLDGRDYETLPKETQYPALSTAQPDQWLPFIPDTALIEWRDLIAAQIAPGNTSRTHEILGQRIMMSADDMRAFIETPAHMDQYLWQNVPPAAVTAVEQSMYAHARRTLLGYLFT